MQKRHQQWGKRSLDMLLTVPALILMAPLMAGLSLILWIGSGNPIIFSQKRPGRHGRPFTLYKFRSMSQARDSQGNMLPDRERLTALGKRLRNLSLDELPALFNVLKGEMSLVGPRPLLLEYMHRYTSEQARRHDMKPGITGWAQVNGRNAITWEEKFRYDVWYVDNWSFGLDLKILLMTLIKVIKTEGINQPGNATMEVFRGTTASDQGKPGC